MALQGPPLQDPTSAYDPAKAALGLQHARWNPSGPAVLL